MQTFTMFKSHVRSAAALDMARLGKQRAETLQILLALRGEGPEVGNPYAYSMWAGYEPALVMYGLVICHEWRIVRRLQDNTWGKFAEFARRYDMLRVVTDIAEQRPAKVETPEWVSEPWVLRSHRSRLIEKFPEHYAPIFGDTPENMPYIWPIADGHGGWEYFISKADIHRINTGERLVPDGLRIDSNRKVTFL